MRKLCKECGLDTKGSRMDLVLRLRTEMQNRSAYDKIFQQIWGASGKLPNSHHLNVYIIIIIIHLIMHKYVALIEEKMSQEFINVSRWTL